MTFEEIADVLGSPLPNSGRTYQAFWSNPTVALPLVRSGFRARPRLAEGRIEFIRIAEGAPTATSRPGTTPIAHSQPDFVLVGCVKTKLPGRHKAQDIYRSTLFLGRRRYAESKGVPWFILSAKHGLLAPDDEIDSYDVSLGDLTPDARSEWGNRVLSGVDQRLGPLNDKTIEIHAGAEYRDYGLRRGLEARGAKVVVPLEGVDFGNQLAWYQAPVGALADRHPGAQTDSISANARLLTEALTREFFEGALDLSLRPDAPIPGWGAMPECVAVEQLLANGATPVDVRIFLTLVAAMDRARDAERLWTSATRLFLSTRWVYQPEEALARPLFELRDALADSGVSQRHGSDSAAWRLILEAINADGCPDAIRRAIFEGTGDAAEILRSVVVTRSSGQP